jgi:hypothetical protein
VNPQYAHARTTSETSPIHTTTRPTPKAHAHHLCPTKPLHSVHTPTARRPSLYFCLFFARHQLALVVARDARPPGFEALARRVEARERMGFRVQHDLVEGQDVVGPEEKVEILECFGLRGLLV